MTGRLAVLRRRSELSLSNMSPDLGVERCREHPRQGKRETGDVAVTARAREHENGYTVGPFRRRLEAGALKLK
eukprot:scaffold9553_cov114-Isochrysis_galbana.AAC.4